MWWKISISVVFTLICLALILVFGPVGLKIAANVARKEAPGKLQYEKISGRLFGPYTVRGLDYQYGNNHIHINYLHFSWKKLNWSLHQVNIKSLKAKGVYLTLGDLSSIAGTHLQDYVRREIKAAMQQQSTDKAASATAPTPKASAQVKKTQTLPTSVASNDDFSWHIQIHKAALSDVHIGKYPKKFPIFIPKSNFTLKLLPKKLRGKLQINVQQPSPLLISAILSGNPQQYHIKSIAQSKHNHWLIEGDGDRKQFKSSHFSGEVLDGNFKGQFIIHWPTQAMPQRNWTLQLSAHDINLSQLGLQQLPKRSRLKLLASEQNNKLQFNLSQLRAYWSDQDYLDGQLHFSYQQQKLYHLFAKFNTQDSHLKIYGDYAEQANLHWQAQLHKLTQWIRHLQGQLNSSGSITGPRNKPYITGHIIADNLSYHGRTMAEAKLHWLIDSSQKNSSQIILQSKQIAYGDIKLQQANLAINGRLANNNIVLKTKSPQAQWFMLLQGAWRNAQWQGSLAQLQLSSKDYGLWKLQQPTMLSFSNQQFNLAPLSWRSSHGTLNAQGNWQANSNWKGNIQAKEINLAIFNHLINPRFQLHSSGNLKWEIAGKAQQLKHWLLNFNIGQGYLHYTSPQAKSTHLQFTKGEFNSILKAHRISSDLQLNLEKAGELQANLELADYHLARLPSPNQSLHGDILIRSNDLTSLAVFIPPAIHTKGQLQAHFKISGSINHPKFDGHAALSQGGMQLPYLGLSLNHIKAKLHAIASIIHYDITLQSAGRPLNLHGTAWLKNKKLYAKARLTGNHVLIMDTPSYTFYASPDLQANIADRDLRINGTLLIPQAMIQPPSFSNVTLMPENTVIVDYGSIQKNTPFYRIFINIKAIAGNNIRFHAIGIDGNIKGQINMLRAPSKQTTASGKIRIVNGSYTVRGKKFSINRGILQFNRTPLTNPNLNVEASRQVSNFSNSLSTAGVGKLTVGFNVSGTLHNPQINLFSRPTAMSQADILSYMLFGYPSSRSSQQDLSILASSISSLALNPKSNSGPSTAERIQQSLHIDHIGFSRNETTDPILGNTLSRSDSALSVGGYLSPRIYLSYEQDTGISRNMVQLRYYITPKWIFQTNTSDQGTGGDLLYSFQRK